MVTFPFLAAGRTCGDEPDAPGAVGVGAGDDQQAVNVSGGVFTKLQRVSSVHDREPPRIGKYEGKKS
jgi:hypothetical protein